MLASRNLCLLPVLFKLPIVCSDNTCTGFMIRQNTPTCHKPSDQIPDIWRHTAWLLTSFGREDSPLSSTLPVSCLTDIHWMGRFLIHSGRTHARDPSWIGASCRVWIIYYVYITVPIQKMHAVVSPPLQAHWGLPTWWLSNAHACHLRRPLDVQSVQNVTCLQDQFSQNL